MLHYAVELSSLQQNLKMRILINQFKILLVYVQPKIYAMSDQCPHEYISLYDNGKLDAKTITCKKHNAKIDMTTGEIINEAHILFVKMRTPRSKVYPVIIKNQKVYVDLPAEAEAISNE